MRFVNALRVLTYLAVLINFVAVLLFLYMFYLVTFAEQEEGLTRTWLDVVFRVGAAIGAFYFWVQFRRELKRARSFKPNNPARAYERPAAPFVIKTYHNSPETEDYFRDKLDVLLTHGVLSQSDLERRRINEALNEDEWETDQDSLCAVLQLLSDSAPDGFDNLYCRVEQVEITQDDYADLLVKLAQMLELEDLPSQIRIQYGEPNSVLRFRWQDAEQSFEGEFSGKYLDWDVFLAVAALLETEAANKRLYVLSVSMRTIVTALEPKTLGVLNTDLQDPDTEVVDWFVPVVS